VICYPLRRSAVPECDRRTDEQNCRSVYRALQGIHEPKQTFIRDCGYDLRRRRNDQELTQQDAQLSQRDRAAGCVIVFAKSKTLELGDNDLWTL